MRKRLYGRTLSRGKNERRALLRSLASSLITYGKIDTTEAKAKAVKPLVEKLVTRSKENSLVNRRLLLAELPNPVLVEKMMLAVGPTFVNRPGGYTRITRLGARPGDNAPIVRLEFVEAIREVKAKASVKTPVKAVKKPTKKVTPKVTAKKAVVKKPARNQKR